MNSNSIEGLVINVICSVTTVFLWMSVLRGFLLPITAGMASFQITMVSYLIVFMVIFLTIVSILEPVRRYIYYFSDFYSATIKDSMVVLKISILLGLVSSVISAIHPDLTLILLALSFLISPILYENIRDFFFPETISMPWKDRKVSTRLLEILIEVIISVLLGFFLTLVIRAVMAIQAVMP